MKLRNLFVTLGLALALGIGAGVGLAAKREVKKVNAAAAGDTLTFYCDVTNASWWSDAGARIVLQTWNGTADVQYEGEWLTSTIFKVEDVDTTGWLGFKFVRHTNGGDNWDFSSWNDNFNNRFFTHAGSDTNGTWSDAVPTTIDVNVTVTFASAVPEYANIHIPGSFNGWAANNTSKMTPNAGRTVFTFAVSVLPNVQHEYLIIACYAGKDVDYNHKLVSNDNITKTFVAGDDGTTINLHNINYDFDTNMPNIKVATGAVITLTRDVPVAPFVNIYFVGGFTGWGNSAENLALSLMTPNAARTVFTLNIPADTTVGTYGFKIVAMYANGGQTSASYDYTIYFTGDYQDASIELDDTKTNYQLESLYDISELGAIAFSKEFLAAMATPCADEDANNKDAVAAIWGTWKSTFEALPEGCISEFASNDNTDIARARGLYLHVLNNRAYGLTPWTNAPVSANTPMRALVVGSNTIMLIAISSSILVVLAVGLLYLRKKRTY